MLRELLMTRCIMRCLPVVSSLLFWTSGIPTRKRCTLLFHGELEAQRAWGHGLFSSSSPSSTLYLKVEVVVIVTCDLGQLDLIADMSQSNCAPWGRKSRSELTADARTSGTGSESESHIHLGWGGAEWPRLVKTAIDPFTSKSEINFKFTLQPHQKFDMTVWRIKLCITYSNETWLHFQYTSSLMRFSLTLSLPSSKSTFSQPS